MTARIFRQVLIVVAVLISSAANIQAQSSPECPASISQAVQEAREALEENGPEQDRAALLCLVAAVETLDKKLSSLIAGEIEFSGPITARGFFHSKPEERAK